MSRPSGRIADYLSKEKGLIGSTPIGDTATLSTGAVYKYTTDLSGTELMLPARLHGTMDYILQIFDKRSGESVLFGMIERQADRIAWKRWVNEGERWESFEVEPDKYRAVIMW